VSEHLKNMFVGLIAAHVFLAISALALWLGINYGKECFLAAMFCVLCGACYGLGYSLRQKWKPTPEGER
jgi:hypothetical protein